MANSILIPNVAKIRHMTALLLGGYSPIDGQCTLHYFANNFSLTSKTVLSDFVEISLAGYSPILLTGAVNLGIVPGDVDQWTWPLCYTTAASTPTFPVTAQGYWVTSNDDGALLWCQSFDLPFTWAVQGDTFIFEPALEGGQIPLPVFRATYNVGRSRSAA